MDDDIKQDSNEDVKEEVEKSNEQTAPTKATPSKKKKPQNGKAKFFIPLLLGILMLIGGAIIVFRGYDRMAIVGFALLFFGAGFVYAGKGLFRRSDPAKKEGTKTSKQQKNRVRFGEKKDPQTMKDAAASYVRWYYQSNKGANEVTISETFDLGESTDARYHRYRIQGTYSVIKKGKTTSTVFKKEVGVYQWLQNPENNLEFL